MLWNTTTSAWVNYYEYQEVLDANNFEKNYEYKEWNDDGTAVTYGDSDVYYFHTVMGINEPATQQQGITVYPNPAGDNITVTTQQHATMEILNLQGQTMMQQPIQQGKTNLDISNLAKGIYMLRLINNDKTEVTRIVKE
jgi:hypothetical protein